MKKIILFVLFLTFFTVIGYSETLLKYKYNKKEGIKTPIEFLQITKNEYDNKHSYDSYDVKHKLKGQILNYSEILEFLKIIKKEYDNKYRYDKRQVLNYSEKLVSEKIPIELPFSQTVDINIKKDGSFLYKGYLYSFEDKDYKYYNENIIFTFNFGLYDTDTYIERIIETLCNTDEVTVLNPVKISYKYNEEKNNFDVIQTILCIDKSGELITEDIETTDTASNVITLKKETLSTQYYINERKERERIAEEQKLIAEVERKKKIKEEEKNKKKRKKELFALAKKMKKWENISEYSEFEIADAFKYYFNASLNQNSSIQAILNLEGGKNIWLPMQIIKIFPGEGFLCVFGVDNRYLYVQYKYTENFVNWQPIEVFAKIIGAYRNNTIRATKLKAYFVKGRVTPITSIDQSEDIIPEDTKYTNNKILAYYVPIIARKIRRKWNWTGNQSFRATAYLKIDRDGNVITTKISKSSGNKDFDETALKAIQLSSPFVPLPESYPDDFLIIHNFEFKMN